MEHYAIDQGLRRRYGAMPQDNIELDTFEEEGDIDLMEEEINIAETAASEGTPLLGGVATGAAVGGIGAITSAVAGTSAGTLGMGAAGVAAIGGIIGAGVYAGTRGNDDDSEYESDDDRTDFAKQLNISGDISSKDNTPQKKPIITIPGHHYLGPGNELGPLSPIDEDDAIAQDHDIRYENAHGDSDITEADDIAIHEFVSDIIENANPHSAVGAIGLGVKRLMEKHTGVLYPKQGMFHYRCLQLNQKIHL